MRSERAQQSDDAGEPVPGSEKKTSRKSKQSPPNETGGTGGFRSAYSTRRRVTTPTGELSLTHQSFKQDSDINVIVDRFARTGELPRNNREPIYVDAPDLEEGNFTSMQQKAAAARTLWEDLPEATRESYGSIEAFLEADHSLDSNAPSEGVQDVSEDVLPAGSEGSNETPEPAEPIDPT